MKKHYYIFIAISVFIIGSLLFCYFNDSIFSSIILSYIKPSSGYKQDAKDKYDKLPIFIQNKLLRCQLNNLSSTNVLKREQALFFIMNFSYFYPKWRKYATVGFDAENSEKLLKMRMSILVNGARFLMISELTALKYQDYFKKGLKSKSRDIREQAVIGLASAYRNDDEKFKIYIIPFCNDENEYVREIAYIYTRLWGMKNWRTFFEKKLEEEKSPKVRQKINKMLKFVRELNRPEEEKDF